MPHISTIPPPREKKTSKAVRSKSPAEFGEIDHRSEKFEIDLSRLSREREWVSDCVKEFLLMVESLGLAKNGKIRSNARLLRRILTDIAREGYVTSSLTDLKTPYK